MAAIGTPAAAKKRSVTIAILATTTVVLGVGFVIAALVAVHFLARNLALQKRVAQLELASARKEPERPRTASEQTRMPVKEVLRLFDLNGFKPDPSGEALVGSMGSIKQQEDIRLLKEPFQASAFQFGFSVKSRWYQGVSVRFGDYRVTYSRGHWLNSAAMLSTPEGERRFPGRIVDKPDEFARIEVRYEGGRLAFDYNGGVEETVAIPAQFQTEPITLGFLGYNSSYAIREVVLTKR